MSNIMYTLDHDIVGKSNPDAEIKRETHLGGGS